MNKKKYNNYWAVPTVISLDELFEKIDQGLIKNDWQYKHGLYNELDIDTKGEIANISRLIENDNLPPKEKKAIEKMIGNDPLNIAERKAKERGIKRLRRLLGIAL